MADRSYDENNMTSELPSLPSMIPDPTHGEDSFSYNQSYSQSYSHDKEHSVNQFEPRTSPAAAAPSVNSSSVSPRDREPLADLLHTPLPTRSRFGGNRSANLSANQSNQSFTPLMSTPLSGPPSSNRTTLRGGSSRGGGGGGADNSDSSSSSRTRFALSGPWNGATGSEATPVQQRGTTAASFDTPAIAADLTMEETVEGSSLEQSYVEEGSEERYYEEEQEGGEEHHESVEDERPQGSLEVSTRSFRSRLPSVELSLVAEEEEEASFVRERSREPEQAEEESKDDLMEESTAEEQSADEDGQDDGSKAVFFQLGRRRSHHPPAPALYHSPASASSHSSTSTPQNNSQSPQNHHYEHTSIILPNDHDSRGEEGFESVLHPADDLTDHHQHSLYPTPSPMKSASHSNLETPGAGRQMSQSPWLKSEYSVPLRGASESPAGGMSAFGTPKPGSITQQDQRKDLVLSTLNSDPRPSTRFPRGTPHFQSRRQSRLPTQSPSFLRPPPSNANTSIGAEEDSSFLSIESAEDLTTLNRANTSLPAIEQSSRLGGMKLQRHLHSLNTQQHLLITTLQDENESLRQQLASSSHFLPESFDASHASSTQPVAHADLEDLHAQLQAKDEQIASLLVKVEAIPEPSSPSSPATPRASSPVDTKSLVPSAELLAAQAELTQLRTVLNLHSTEVAGLRSDLESAHSTSETQTRDFQIKTEKLEADVLEILGLKEGELEALKAEKAKLAADREEDKAAMVGEREKVESELRTVQAELEGIRAAAKESNNEIERLEALVASKSREVESQATVISQLTTEPSPPPEPSSTAAASQDSSSTIRETLQLRQSLVDQQTELHAIKVSLEEEQAESTRLQGLLREAEEKIDGLEEEVEKEREREEEQSIRIEEAEVKLEKSEEVLREQEKKLKEMEQKAANQEEVVSRLEQEQDELTAQLEQVRADLAETESRQAGAESTLSNRISSLETQHSSALQLLQDQHSSHLSSLQQALDEAQSTLESSQSTVTQLRADLLSAQQQRRPSPSPSLSARSSHHHQAAAEENHHDAQLIEQLESDLEAANVKIGRLEADLVSSPFKRTAIESRDLRIQMLEAMNSSLGARMAAVVGVAAQGQGQKTPGKASPAMRRMDVSHGGSFANDSIMSLKTPKVPGSIRKMPWLETPTSGRSSFNPASSASETDSDDDQILALRAELSSLNAVLDSNLAKIEDIGSERLDYFERLAAAEEELVLLKEKLKEGKREVERLGRVEAELAEADGREREMEKELKELRSEIISLSSNLTTLKTQLVSVQSAQLSNTDAQLASLRQQTVKLEAELQKAEEARDHHQQVVADIEGELEASREEFTFAQKTIESLERDVQTLEQANTDYAQAVRQSEDVKSSSSQEVYVLQKELDTARSRLQNAERQAEEARRAHQDQTNALQASRNHLGSRTKEVERLQRQTESLFQSRATMEEEHQRAQDELRQELLTTATTLSIERSLASQLRSSLSTLTSQNTHLTTQNTSLQSQLRSSSSNACIISDLQSDVSAIRKEADRWARDLRGLREREGEMIRAEGLERGRWEVEKRDLEGRVGELEGSRKRLEKDVLKAEDSVAEMKLKSRREAKGLLLDISYLKTKFTRENSFREDLSLQKEYLLILIGGLSRQQSRIYASLAQFGPLPGSPDLSTTRRKRPTLKAVGHAVIMIIRTRKLAKEWKKACEVKAALQVAVERVRAQRAIKGSN